MRRTVALTATVTGGATGAVYAMTAQEASSQGDFGATALSPSSTWNVSPSSGAFNWSYPLRVPPVPGGAAPSIALTYNSQTVDGRTASTNNQGSWLGEGFSYEPGYVERQYKPCVDDGHDGGVVQHDALVVRDEPQERREGRSERGDRLGESHSQMVAVDQGHRGEPEVGPQQHAEPALFAHQRLQSLVAVARGKAHL